MKSIVTFAVALVLATAVGFSGAAAADEAKRSSKQRAKTYIVQMKSDPIASYDGRIEGYAATKPAKGQKVQVRSAEAQRYAARLEALHDEALASVGGGSKVYDYNVVFNGFAAVMTADQAEALRARGDVANVWEDERLQPQTNSTPTFMGLTSGGDLWSKGVVGENVIIGIIDTGIQPDHPSLADVATPKKGNKGPKIPYGPPPSSWSGTGCAFGNTAFNANDAAFTCNNKLLKAQAFPTGFQANEAFAAGEFLSARDSDGHGSHTATTAGGNFGVPAVIDGQPRGRVSGIAPRARIAVYKVCWDAPNPDDSGCFASDSMAAINRAVADGVDVINFSIGGAGTSFLGADDVAFLNAADAGVFVAVSGGNDGPGAQTIGTPSGVPWVTATGASEDDENFGTGLQVTAPTSVAAIYEGLEGTGPVTIAGTGLLTGSVVPSVPADGCDTLTNAAAVSNNIALVIRGVCNFDVKYNNAAAAGAKAIVVYNDGATPARVDPAGMSAPGTTIPGIMISFHDGVLLRGTAAVTGALSPEISVPRIDRITGFSSRGPNGGAPDIIKPDVTAPGVGIIAGETLFPNAVASGGQLFQFLSGTSMASPHVAGALALIKEAHPDWSPAMARSALMTTARQDLRKSFGDATADPFDIGAGLIVPNDALDPGLVYDADLLDYVAFMCGAANQGALFSPATCAGLAAAGLSLDSSDLNLPSIGIAELVGTQTIRRTVTNVGTGKKPYRVSVDAPAGIDVQVSPSTLHIKAGESATYEVTFSTTDAAVSNQWAFGSLTWTHGKERVRSPIAIRPTKLSAPAALRAEGSPGTLGFEVKFGYSGAYQVAVNGLVAGDRRVAEVADSTPTTLESGVEFFTIPAGVTTARWAIYDEDIGDGDGSDDFDLVVIRCTNAACSTADLVGSSGSATSEEAVTANNPVAGTYIAFIDDFATAPGPTEYRLFHYQLRNMNALNTTVTVPAAVLNTTGNVTVNWTGLGAGTRHLGFLNHNDGTAIIGSTELLINTQ